MNNQFDKFFSDEMMGSSEVFPIISLDERSQDIQLDEGAVLPILPLRNMVIFPGVLLPVSVARPKSLKLVRKAHENDGLIGVCTQIDRKLEDPSVDQLYTIGTVAQVVRILEMPDGSTTVILEGKRRFRLGELVTIKPYMKARVHLMEDIIPEEKKNDGVFPALVSSIKDLATDIITNSGMLPPETTFAIRNIENPVFLINYICVNFGLQVKDKIHLLELDDVLERGYHLLELLNKESQLIEIKMNIQNKAKAGIDQQQREYFLQQQMKTIQNELGVVSPEQDVADFKERAKRKKWSEPVARIFDKELKKLERTSQHSPDYSIQLNYIETMLDLPWNEYTVDNFNLKNAMKVLNADHFGMEKVKDRIIEHLAVLKLKGDMKSPILCFVGPPGIGKTSLGKSIASSINRKYVRLSLGGLHDESELRGHRKTYIGAMPGRIIQSLRKSKSANPVFILDEIDKVGKDFRGDPSSALLEVLDPEQNNSFYDNYLELEFDLSKVLFIATANNLGDIQPALRDRLEIIHLTGYSLEEKIEIGKRHLVPKQKEMHGLDKLKLKFSDKVLGKIIHEYTRESGVRELDRTIASMMRSIARKVAMEEKVSLAVTEEQVEETLGKPKFINDLYVKSHTAGVAVGLAWTSVGGDILFIEAALSKGKGSMDLTGNLGNVMKESAHTALTYLKAHALEYKIDPDIFDKNNVHVHVPEGAVPKDGPSAGITMLSALASAFTGRRLRSYLAMTGEITLRGQVLPVGGIKEKILAAKRAGIKEIILCRQNQKDVEEINKAYIKGLTFHYVSEMNEVLELALMKR